MLGWIGFVPLFAAVRGLGTRGVVAYGWLAGFAYFSMLLPWVGPTVSNFTRIPPVVANGLWLLMAISAAYTFAAFVGVVEWLARRGVPRLVSAPVAWVVLEWMRTFVVAAFPWGLLGYSQHRWLTIIQIADLGGVYLISAAMMLVNVALADIRSGQRPRRAVTVAVATVVAVCAYGTLRLSHYENAPVVVSLPVGIVQANVAQKDKWRPGMQDEILARYLRLSAQAAEAGARLIAWPESALTFDPRYDARAGQLTRFAASHGIHLITGSPGYDQDSSGRGRSYNRAWMVNDSGRFDRSYDKIQLVPFGEYIPLGGLFGMVDLATESVGLFQQGSQRVVFTGPLTRWRVGGGSVPTHFATVICYEAIFPGLTRSFVAAGADFLVNISNDAWYGDTAAPHQHLAMAAMRAVENRVPLVRSTNTGISAFVSADGAIGATTPLFQADVLVEDVLLRDMDSLYRRVGNAFVYLCLAMLAGMLWIAARRTPVTGAPR